MGKWPVNWLTTPAVEAIRARYRAMADEIGSRSWPGRLPSGLVSLRA